MVSSFLFMARTYRGGVTTGSEVDPVQTPIGSQGARRRLDVTPGRDTHCGERQSAVPDEK